MIEYLTKEKDYGEIEVQLESPDIEDVKNQGFAADETSKPKDFLHIQIITNEDCPKSTGELSKFEIYPQLEVNAKRDVINNLPLYNASLISKYLKIKLSAKTEGKCGFDIYLNIEKP